MIKKSIVSILILLILVNSMGCYSYTTLRVEDIDKTDIIKKMKILTNDNKLYILTNVTIEESQIRGFVPPEDSEGLKDKQIEEVVIPLEEIKGFEVQEFDTALTILALAIVGIIALFPLLGYPNLGNPLSHNK